MTRLVAPVLLLATALVMQAQAGCRFVKYRKYALYGLNNDIIRNLDVLQCESSCEQKVGYECKSYDYIPSTRTCFLSAESRSTQPQAFGKHGRSDHYEKVCDDDTESSGSGSDQEDCDDGWLEFDRHCYQLVTDADKSWSGAQAECKKRGAHTVFVNGEAEMEFVTSAIREKLGGRIGLELWWTGGVLVHGSWFWEDGNGQRIGMGYRKWYPGEPNNDRNREDVINLLYKNGRWGFNDSHRYDRYRYICEKEN